MLVGGPGSDAIAIGAADRWVDTFRISGGGRDDVDCLSGSARGDVFFADEGDLLDVACGGRVLFRARPEIFP